MNCSYHCVVKNRCLCKSLQNVTMVTWNDALYCSLQWRLNEHDGFSNHPASRLFAQPFVQAQIKGSIKAPRSWPFWGETTVDQWIPLTKAQWRKIWFHLMTSSYSIITWCFHTLWPCATIWRHEFGSPLTQLMACCLTASSHYLNHCWLLTKGVWHPYDKGQFHTHELCSWT